MDHIVINIICGPVIGSAVIQGGSGSTIDYSLPEIAPTIVEALRTALGDIVGTDSTVTNGKGLLVPTRAMKIGRNGLRPERYTAYDLVG